MVAFQVRRGLHVSPYLSLHVRGYADTRTRNALQRSLRCLGERGFALLTGRWRTLQHITASPGKIGDITRAALVLTHFEHGYIT